jgi:hypothetical protein
MSLPNTFITERLPLAIYLHADGRLNFLGCEHIRPGQVQFVFDDPNGSGSQIELEFERGAMVVANSVFCIPEIYPPTYEPSFRSTTENRKRKSTI